MTHVTGSQHWLHIRITWYSLKVGWFFTIWAKNSGVGSQSPLTRASPVAQRSNLGLLHYSQILYRLSNWGSPGERGFTWTNDVIMQWTEKCDNLPSSTEVQKEISTIASVKWCVYLTVYWTSISSWVSPHGKFDSFSPKLTSWSFS